MSGILDQNTDSIARAERGTLCSFSSSTASACHSEWHPPKRSKFSLRSRQPAAAAVKNQDPRNPTHRSAPSFHPQASAVLSSAQCSSSAAQQLFCFVFNSRKRFPTGMMVAAVAPHAASGLSCQSAPPPQPRLRCTLGRGLGARGQKPPARLGFAVDADDDARHKS